jgi:hypothetical protein
LPAGQPRGAGDDKLTDIASTFNVITAAAMSAKASAITSNSVMTGPATTSVDEEEPTKHVRSQALADLAPVARDHEFYALAREHAAEEGSALASDSRKTRARRTNSGVRDRSAARMWLRRAPRKMVSRSVPCRRPRRL